MATWATVSRLARVLPETVESATKADLHEWRVKGKLLAWERPLRRSDLEALGDQAPTGAILGVIVPDLETKDLLITHRPEIYFTTPHFNGYAMVLVRLSKIPVGELKELLAEGWRVRAPKRVAKRTKKKSTR